jgi:hypothetical protein
VVNHIDNPAGRLHDLLLKLAQKRSVYFRDALCDIYQVERDNALEVSPVILRVVQLPDKAKEQVQSLDESLYDAELILKWYQPVRNLLSWSAFSTTSPDAEDLIKTLSADVMLSLEFCSDLLHRYRPEYVLQNEEMQRISDLISELGNEIADPAVDPELRAFLLDHLKEMESAIAAFPISGVGALTDALDKTVGSLNRRSDIVVKAEKSQSVWAKFGNLIVVVAAVCQITGAQLALPSLIRQELASGSGGHSAQVVIDGRAAAAPSAAREVGAEQDPGR